MKRDISIPLALIFGVGAIGAYVAWDIPDRIFSDDPLWFKIPFWVGFVSILRIIILWFQTLFAVIVPKTQERAKIGWVISHFIFGFFASLLYYFVTRDDSPAVSLIDQEAEIKRRANEGRL